MSGMLPKLRFPEFRNAGDWVEKRLGEVAERVNSKNSDHHNTRVLTNSAVEGIVDQRDYFDKDIANKNNLTGYFVVEKGDHVYNPRVSANAPVGPIGRNNIGAGIMSPLYTVFRFHESNSDYHEHYFNTSCWHDYIRAVGSSGARHDRMSLSVSDFMNTPVLEPCVEEQQKIADCLSFLDDLITAQVQKMEHLKTHKKGLMQQLFPAEGETLPKFRFPEFQDAGDWEEKTLGSLTNITIGEFVIKTKQNPSSPYPVYNGGRSYTGFYDEYNNEANKIIISARGANAGFVNIIKQRYWAGNSCYSIKVINENIDLTFLFNYIKRFQRRFTDNQQAANIPSVSKGDVTKFKVLYPTSLIEQQKIADCLSSLDDLITAQTQKLVHFKTHKKGLMQQLFPSAEEKI